MSLVPPGAMCCFTRTTSKSLYNETLGSGSKYMNGHVHLRPQDSNASQRSVRRSNLQQKDYCFFQSDDPNKEAKIDSYRMPEDNT